jgi:translocation and assembly module TamB
MLTYFIVAIALAVLLAFLAGIGWLFGTTAGAHRLLDAVSRHTGIKISAEKIEGKLAGTLRLENVAIQWPQGKIRIQRVALSTQPLDLLAGELSIQNLSLRNVSVSDNTPDTPPRLIWPQASGVITLVSGKIERLEINNLTYRHLDKQPLQFQTIVASAYFRHSQLAVSNLHMVSDPGVVDGNILTGFNRPLLEMDLTAISPNPLAGMNFFRLAGKFGPGLKAGELAGSLRLSGRQNKQPVWEMSADTGMTSGGFALRHIRLYRPGQPGVITADGMLTFIGPEFFLTMQAQVADLDLAPEIKVSTKISGSLTFAGSIQQYRGRFTLANKGKDRESIRLASDYSGNSKSVTLNAIRGTALGGILAGDLNIDWQNGMQMKGALSGQNLNPAVIDPSWTGVINFDLEGGVSASKQEPLGGEVICTLRQSRLHGQQLTGNLRAAFSDDNIRIQRLALRGKGFQLTASGAVKNKLDFTARISDLSRLVPETTGSITANGWMRWRSGRPSGVISAQARGLSAGDLEIASGNLAAAIDDQDKSPLDMNATLNNVRYQRWEADTVTFQAKGTAQEHTLTAALHTGRYEAHLTLSGTYRQNSWQGKVTRLDGTDGVGPWRLSQPAALSVTSNSLSFSPLMITGRNAESVKISGSMASEPLTGSLAFQWNALNLARANAWMNSEVITGSTSGNILLNLLPQKRLTLTGKFSANGTFQAQGQTLSIRQSEITMEANEQGTRAGLNIDLAQGGKLQGTFTSSAPARMALPEEGLFNLHWRELNLAPLSVWLPGRAKMEGQMAGEIRGKLLPNRRFDLTGHAVLAQSKVHWQGQKGDINIGLRRASLTWVWQEEALSGDMALTMADYGKLQSQFRLPVAARFPIAINTRGSLQGSLTGQVREKGALGVLFPGLVQESRGDLDVDLKMSGSPAEPLISGNAHLSRTGAYLPTAGITVKDAQITARLAKDAIIIDSFRAVSGPGYIDGSALIRLKGWQVIGYEGRLGGDRFQTIYFPELQVQSSPTLTFTGTPEKISVRGEVLLPQVQIIGSQSQGPVESSPDVVREGKIKPAAKKLPINLDVQVKVILGDRVQFNASGIDAQLGGQINLQFREIEKIVSQGEIRVVKGRFRTYGVNLDIARGRLFYAGGPINQPLLDILALRKVGDVKAGVAVSGMLQNPLIKLYSEPFMQDMDILAYIVLGHPLGSDAKQANLLALAAGALLTSRQSESLLKQIKNRLGLTALDISTDIVDKNEQMGYKRINVAPAGASVSETMLVVGKYLTPQLYISYGRSLFSGGNLFFLRYDVSKSWQIETQTGQESGVDIYYKLEFN